MPIRKQHVVSRSVLTSWTVDAKLAEFELRNGRMKLKSTAATAYVEWFVQADYSTVIEGVWQEVERRVPELVRSVEAGTAFDDETLDGLRQLIAVHITRSKQMTTIWESLYDQQRATGRLARIRRELLTPEANRLLAEHRTGLALPFDLPVDVGSGPHLKRLDEAAGPGGPWFIELALTNHQRLIDLLRGRFVQIGHCEGLELVIGDNPATTFDPTRNVAGLLAGANLTDSTILMPLTPNYVIAFGRPGGYHQLTSAQVGVLNDIQLATAHRHAYAKPGTAAAIALAIGVQAERHRRMKDDPTRPDSAREPS